MDVWSFKLLLGAKCNHSLLLHISEPNAVFGFVRSLLALACRFPACGTMMGFHVTFDLTVFSAHSQRRIATEPMRRRVKGV